MPSPSSKLRNYWAVPSGDPKRPKTLEEACGQVIARYRDDAGLSQMDLAVASGYSLRYIGDVERGTKSATLRTMNDLATLLNIGLGALITEAEDSLGSAGAMKKRPTGHHRRT